MVHEWVTSYASQIPERDDEERTSLLYSARLHKNTLLIPIDDSLTLKAASVKTQFEKTVTMEQWVKAQQLCSIFRDRRV
jgi:hypothetical protein